MDKSEPLKNSRKSERSGRLARRKKRTHAKQRKNVLVLLLFPLMAKARVPHLLAINKPVALSNYHPSDTNPAHKYQDNTKLLLALATSSNCRSMAIVTSSTLAIQLRHMAHLTRYNPGAAPKYEH
jgi:hypothetical protein